MGSNDQIIIIGAGLTGLSCAYHLHKPFKVLEKNSYAGGLSASTIRTSGPGKFTFDWTGHLLHLHNKYSAELVKRLLKGNLNECARNAAVFFRHKHIPFPFQGNLYHLPEKEREECLRSLPEVQDTAASDGRSFHDWCISVFGEGIAKYCLIPYTEKSWAVKAAELTSKWHEDFSFVPVLSREEIIEGAKKDMRKKFGYNATFYYPANGGIQALSDRFVHELKGDTSIGFNENVKEINIEESYVRTETGKSYKYEHLVSTMPLVDLIDILRPHIPEEVKKAKDLLRHSSVMLVNLGIHKKNIHPDIKGRSWIYFPDKKTSFYRAGVASNFSDNVAPKDHVSIYLEWGGTPSDILNKYKEAGSNNKEDFWPRTLKELNDNNILCTATPESAISVLEYIPYAYVTYDKNRSRSLKIIFDFLEKYNVHSTGRYGGWKYSFMEEAILDGKITAERISR